MAIMGVNSSRRLFIQPAVIVLLASLLLVTYADAGGFRVYDQSASGAAQGNAFIAQADDPSALYYNCLLYTSDAADE